MGILQDLYGENAWIITSWNKKDVKALKKYVKKLTKAIDSIQDYSIKQLDRVELNNLPPSRHAAISVETIGVTLALNKAWDNLGNITDIINEGVEL